MKTSMDTKKIVIAAVILLIILAGGFMFFKSRAEEASEDAMTEQTQSVAPSASTIESASGSAMTTGEVKELTVTGSNFKFEPATLTVNKGDKVKITFKNTTGIHDFIIDEFNVATKVINGGASETVEFTADKAGTFEYYCGVGNHRAMGMKGTLTVQ